MYSLRDALSKFADNASLLGQHEYVNNILIVFQEAIFNFDLKRFVNFTLVDLVIDTGFQFKWRSKSKESVCPRCGRISNHQRHTYKDRTLVDQEIFGRPVTHIMRSQLYICDYCSGCEGAKSFVEDLSSICRPGLKTTRDLDEKIVNDGISRSAHGLANDYDGRISVSCDTILRRVKEAGGIVTEKRLTDTKGISVLSVDDNNGRKGNPSTACTVAIDLDTHDVLVVAQGATSEVAKKILDRFPEATTLSRDRACAYSKAAKECSLEQVADIFHLIQNAHMAVKEELSRNLRQNVYIHEGDGWIEWSANPNVSSSENPVPVFTLAEDDIAERVRLAHLSVRQAAKYRKVINLLRLYDEGLSRSEIAKRLGLTEPQSRSLLVDAATVVNDVERKIDEYLIDSTRPHRCKTIGKNARPSSESIVEPYSEIVMKMVAEGKTHRTIHPVIEEMGYMGSANSIYQYILKRRSEESATNTEDIDETPPAKMPCPTPDSFPQRPKRVCLQRVAKTNVYKYVLREVAASRELNKDKEDRLETDQKASLEEANSVPEVLKTEPTAATNPPISKPTQASSAFYSDDVADILFRKVTKADDECKKKRRARSR